MKEQVENDCMTDKGLHHTTAGVGLIFFGNFRNENNEGNPFNVSIGTFRVRGSCEERNSYSSYQSYAF